MSKETKKFVYVLTSGTYSDYGIDAIYSTKEKAVEQRDIRNKYERETRIEKWELDGINYPSDKIPYFVRMGKNGEVLACYISLSHSMDGGFDVDGNLFCCVFANNDQHAIKIVNERRSQLLALDRWGIQPGEVLENDEDDNICPYRDECEQFGSVCNSVSCNLSPHYKKEVERK